MQLQLHSVLTGFDKLQKNIKSVPFYSLSLGYLYSCFCKKKKETFNLPKMIKSLSFFILATLSFYQFYTIVTLLTKGELVLV